VGFVPPVCGETERRADKMHVPKKIGPTTAFLFIIIAALQIQQLAPGTVIDIIVTQYGLSDYTTANMSLAVVYPLMVAGSIVGGFIGRKLGVKNLFSIVLFLFVLSGVIHLFAVNMGLFLTARSLYGLAFGIYVPGMGMAIEGWYLEKQRYIPSTLNAFVIYVGAVICYALYIPLLTLFNNNLNLTFGVWSVLPLIILGIWNTLFKKITLKEAEGLGLVIDEPNEKGLYRGLLKRKEILLLNGVWIFDYFTFAYLGVTVMSYMMGHFTLSAATIGLIISVAFCAVGLPATIFGGFLMKKLGRNNLILRSAQFIKATGCILIAFGSQSVFLVVLGVMMFGFGNAFWMPPMYQLPTELEDMNPTRVGGAFVIGGVAGFLFAFFGPLLGAAIQEAIAGGAALDASGLPTAAGLFGMKWMFFICGVLEYVAFVLSLFIRETGPKAKWRQTQAA
jgi:MFS family permease